VSASVLAADGLVAGLVTWAGTAAAGACAGLSFGSLLAAGANAVPAAVLALGAGMLAYGLAPRLAAAVAYGIVAWAFFVEIIGAGTGASGWLLDTSGLHHIARAPATAVRWGSAAILIAIE
jgi:ABC-2 type transport system permease protein